MMGQLDGRMDTRGLTKYITLMFFAISHVSESWEIVNQVHGVQDPFAPFGAGGGGKVPELIFNVASVRYEAERIELISKFKEVNNNIDEENIKIKSRIASFDIKPSEVKILQHISDNTFYRCSFSGTTFALKFNSPQVFADDVNVNAFIGKTDEVYPYTTVLGAIKRIPLYRELSDNEIVLRNKERRLKALAQFPEKYTPKQKIHQKEFVENLKNGQTYKFSSSIDVNCPREGCRGGRYSNPDPFAPGSSAVIKCENCRGKGKMSIMIQCKMIWDKNSRKLKWVENARNSRYEFLLR
jgi:hypothetical protein